MVLAFACVDHPKYSAAAAVAEIEGRVAFIQTITGVTTAEARRRYGEAIAPSKECHVSGEACWAVYRRQVAGGMKHVEAMCAVNEFIRIEIEKRRKGL